MWKVLGRFKKSLFCMVSTSVVVSMRAYHVTVDRYHSICGRQTTDNYIAKSHWICYLTFTIYIFSLVSCTLFSYDQL